MAELLSSVFSLTVMRYALIVGVPVALCAALLGVLLVLRRYSMIGDGLSHVGFGALSVAYALHMAPMAVAVPVVILAAFLLLGLSGSRRLRGDSAIAVLSSSALALGVVANSLAGGSATDLSGYLFGSILTLGREAVSQYQQFDETSIAVAAFMDENAPDDALFLTGTQHLNPVVSLAGRDIVCGSSLYVYYHGMDYAAQLQAVANGNGLHGGCGLLVQHGLCVIREVRALIDGDGALGDLHAESHTGGAAALLTVLLGGQLKDVQTFQCHNLYPPSDYTSSVINFFTVAMAAG